MGRRGPALIATRRRGCARQDRAFEAVRRRLADGVPTTEYDIQQQMVAWFAEEGLVAESPPNVSAQANAGNPHYLPTATRHRAIRADELLLIDLWGKRQAPRAVYADITWVAFTGHEPPAPITRAFAAVTEARDRVVAFVQDAPGRTAVRGSSSTG